MRSSGSYMRLRRRKRRPLSNDPLIEPALLAAGLLRVVWLHSVSLATVDVTLVIRLRGGVRLALLLVAAPQRLLRRAVPLGIAPAIL